MAQAANPAAASPRELARQLQQSRRRPANRANGGLFCCLPIAESCTTSIRS